MAKRVNDDTSEIKKLLEGLYKIVQTTNASSQEQIKINKELLKVMSLLQSGFVKNEEDARQLIEDVRDGLEIQDEFAVKWAKARKAEQKDVDQILKKFRELEQINENQIDSAEDYLDLLTERYDVIEGEYDLSKSILRSQKDILKVIKDAKGVYEQIGGNAVNIDDTLSKIVRKKVSFDDLFSGMNNSFEEAEGLVEKIQTDIKTLISNVGGNIIDFPFNFNPLTDDVDKEIEKVIASIDAEKMSRIKGLEEYFAKNEKLQKDLARNYAAEFSGLDIKIDVETGELTKGLIKIQNNTAEYAELIKDLDSIVLKNNIGEQISNSFAEMNTLLTLGIKRTDEQNNRLNELIKPVGLSNKLLIEQLQIKNDDLDLLTHSIQGERAKYAIIAKNLGVMKTTENVVMKIGDSFDYISSLLPTGVADLLGFSNVSTTLLSNHTKGIEAMSNKLIEGGSRASALKEYYKSMTPALKGVLTPMNLLIAGGILLYKYVSGMTNKLKSMSGEMKVSLVQSKALLETQLNILTSSNNQFSTLKDIQDIQSELIGSSGKVFNALEKGNEQVIISISEMSKAFGYSATEATKIHKIFSGLGADDSLAVNLQTNLGLISEMAGLSPQIVGNDLLEASEEVYTYFAGMPEKAAQAAINVRKMGMSLKQAGSIAQKMLDLEGFMTDMYELNAMSNRGIDFSKAFDMGLMGDVEGMTKEIMENIGGTAEFSKMDYLTRTKIAKTLGMSMEDLSKSVKMHEQMSNFSGDEKANLEANIDRMGDISKLGKDQIRERLQQLQSTDRLNIAWDKIKGVLIKSLLPLVESFADGIDAVMPIIDLVIGAFKVVGLVIKPIAFLIKGLLTPLSLVGDAISKISEFFFGTGTAVENVNQKLDGLKTPIQLIGTLLGTWFIGKKLFGGIDQLKEQTKGIGSLIPSIGGLLGSVFTKSSQTAQADMQTVNKSIADINPTIQTVAANSKQIVSEVSKQTVAAGTEITKTTTQINQNLDNVKKKSTGLFSNLGATQGFGVVREIATKTLAMIAINQAKTFLGFGKTAADGITENKGEIEAAMSGAFSVGGILLSGYLDQAMSKVFEKRLEKKFESSLEPLKDKSKSIFGKIGEYAKNLIPSKIETPTVETAKDVITNTIDKSKTITDTIDTQKRDINQTDKQTDVISKKQITEQVTTKQIQTPTVDDKPVRKIPNIFTTLSDTIKNVWKSLKSTLIEIVDFTVTVIQKISKGIGDVVNNLLTGIANGLKKFNTNAIKGAASLLIVSGALWITSKALQNFSNVSWLDISKGIVTLGGLVLVSTLLGKVTGQLIKGAIGIAVLGASLIPLSYSMQKFNEIEWSSIGKGIAAILGLSVISTVLSPLLPTMLAASLGIAVLGASMIPLTFALTELNKVEWSSIGKGITALLGFGVVGTMLGTVSPLLIAGAVAFGILNLSIMSLGSSITIMQTALSAIQITTITTLYDALNNLTNLDLSNVSIGIASISAALLTLSMSQTFGVISNGFSSLFGNNIGEEIQHIASSAEPLKIVSDSILILTESIERLNNIASDIDLTKLNDKLNIDLESKANLIKNEDVNKNVTFNEKFNPIRSQIQPQPPAKESTAQNINVTKIVERQKELEIQRQTAASEEMELNTDSLSNISTKRLEQLMQQMITILSNQQQQPTNINLDGYSVGKIVKKHFNS